MKPYLCWLLAGLLLLTGCVQPQGDGDPQEARPTVTVTYYSEPTAVAPARGRIRRLHERAVRRRVGRNGE